LGMKEGLHCQQYRNKNGYKGLFLVVACQQVRYPRQNEEILRKSWLLKLTPEETEDLNIPVTKRLN
jgi:hypothetical protein